MPDERSPKQFFCFFFSKKERFFCFQTAYHTFLNIVSDESEYGRKRKVHTGAPNCNKLTCWVEREQTTEVMGG